MNAIDHRVKTLSAIDLAVQKELIAILFGSPAVPLLNGAVVLVTAGVLWRVFPRIILLSWLLVAFFVLLGRMMLWLQFTRRGAGIRRTDQWARLYTQSTALIGCLWGLVAVTVLRRPRPHRLFLRCLCRRRPQRGRRHSKLSPSRPLSISLSGPPSLPWSWPSSCADR